MRTSPVFSRTLDVSSCVINNVKYCSTLSERQYVLVMVLDANEFGANLTFARTVIMSAELVKELAKVKIIYYAASAIQFR